MNILALLWIGIIALGIILYVLLDGFDLGIGIMSIFFKNELDRDLMISTIMPVWDGNETWLVFGGAALYGAFPLAFSVILPKLYIPILVMVIALIFRGVAFEFRLKAHKSKRLWEILFFVGSVLATSVQGLTLGRFVSGFIFLDSGQTAAYQWIINPFGIFCAIALMFGYVLLGSNWLIAKTTGALQNVCFRVSTIVQYAVIACAIVVSIWSPYLDPLIMARWFNLAYMPYLVVFPILTIGFIVVHWFALRARREYLPFWMTISIFIMCYLGFIISCYPFIVPRHITYWQAAAPSNSLLFMLIGAIIMLPLLLAYTFYSYHIFKGKVTQTIGY